MLLGVAVGSDQQPNGVVNYNGKSCGGIDYNIILVIKRS